jgi:hypothetical protein
MLTKLLAGLLAALMMAFFLTAAQSHRPLCDEDNCNAVLSVATDFLKLDTNESFTSHMHQWLKTATREEVSKATSAGLDLAGLGLPGASFSEEEWRKFEHNRDQGKIEDLSQSKLLSMIKTGPNPVALDKWLKCMTDQQSKAGLRVLNEELRIRSINGKKVGALSLTLRYNKYPYGGAPDKITLDTLRVSPANAEDVDVEPSPKVLDAGLARTLKTIYIPLDDKSRWGDFTVILQPAGEGEWRREYRFKPFKEYKAVDVSLSTFKVNLNGGNRFNYSFRISIEGQPDVSTPGRDVFDQELKDVVAAPTKLRPGSRLRATIYLSSPGVGGGQSIALHSIDVPYDRLEGEQTWSSPEFNFRAFEAGGPLPQYGALVLRTVTKKFD